MASDPKRFPAAPKPVSAPQTGRAMAGRGMRLEALLRLLPDKEFRALVTSLKLSTDRSKRIDLPAQVARALISRPLARDPSSLPEPAQQLLRRIIEANGALTVRSLPTAVQPLVAQGLVFARATRSGQAELLLPVAYVLQLPAWEGEAPNALRRLLLQANSDVLANIAAHYLGTPATHPLTLSLEPAWLLLSDPELLAGELAQLSEQEARLLEAIEDLGGEVETEELLELEREPLRLRTASGATPSRRGVGFALERRGLLIPVHPDRHVIPSEVAEQVGAPMAEKRRAQRAAIIERLSSEDHGPRRARFASDVAPLALAQVAYVREKGVEAKPGLGTPRSLLARLATRHGQELEQVSLVAALSRAAGLWDISARNRGAPPGSLTLSELGRTLFDLWYRGSVWDEARADPEVLRSQPAARETGAVVAARQLVLSALGDLAEDRWVPWDAISGFIDADSRAPGVQRLLDRAAKRSGGDAAQGRLLEVARRVLFDSLYQLGCVDISTQGEPPAVRVTPRGRCHLRSLAAPPTGPATRFVGDHTLRFGSEAQVAQVLSVFHFSEVGAVEPELEVVVTRASISAALARGLEPAVMRRRLSELCPLPDALSIELQEAGAVVGRAEHVAAAGFLWVADSEVRALLSRRRQTTDLFVDPSPPGGLLLAPGVDLERLIVRCRVVGVEILAEGGTRRLSAGAAGGPDSAPRDSRRSSRSLKPSGRSGAASTQPRIPPRRPGASAPGDVE